MRIGASVTLTDICEHPIINRDYPVVAQAARTISTPLLRNMGTIGGNLLLDTRCNYYDQNYEWRKGINFCLKKDGDVCWVAPGSSKCWAVQSSDLVPVMVAIGAKLRFASTLGERVIDAAGLYNDDGIDYLHKRPDELLVDIQLPPTNGWRASYQKLRRRGAFDFPVLGVAAWIKTDNDDSDRRAHRSRRHRSLAGRSQRSRKRVDRQAARQTIKSRPPPKLLTSKPAHSTTPTSSINGASRWRDNTRLRALRDLQAS